MVNHTTEHLTSTPKSALKRNINFRVPAQLTERLALQVEQRGRRQSEIIRTAIEHYLLILESLPVSRKPNAQ